MNEGERTYNQIYTKLVTDNTDIIGLVAYGIYKRHKLNFCTQFRDEYGRQPSHEECRVFYSTTNASDQLNQYRKTAEDIVSDIVMNTSLSEIQSFEEEMLRDYEEKIGNAVRSNVPTSLKTFLYGIFASIGGAIIYAGLMYFFKHIA